MRDQSSHLHRTHILFPIDTSLLFAYNIINPRQPLHLYCRCKITWLRALLAGTATDQGMNGADWWLKNRGKLPAYYISKQEAEKLDWDSALGNLHVVCPGKTLARGEYKNKNGHLPSAPGRIWYEADINYRHGFRGLTRIVYSNDGLIFVTYDHYVTFIEIV